MPQSFEQTNNHGAIFEDKIISKWNNNRSSSDHKYNPLKRRKNQMNVLQISQEAELEDMTADLEIARNDEADD